MNELGGFLWAIIFCLASSEIGPDIMQISTSSSLSIVKQLNLLMNQHMVTSTVGTLELKGSWVYFPQLKGEMTMLNKMEKQKEPKKSVKHVGAHEYIVPNRNSM